MNSQVLTILWAAPAILLSAIIIGWGAETAQIFISQGLALAILAWLQTAPEFAVEAVIAWRQEQNLMVANLTGSLRLLVGFGWPMIYFAAAFLGKQKKKNEAWPIIRLPSINGLEVLVLMISTLYFIFVLAKGTLTVFDGVLLIAIYAIYLYRLSRLPRGAEPHNDKDLPWIAYRIHNLSLGPRIWAIFGLFAVGGVILMNSAGPFLHSLEAIAAAFGLSTFIFVQWCAPFVSEFPEKVTAFMWARTGKKAPMALMNMVGSNVVQWTLMAGLIPIIYSVSKGEVTVIHFDLLQKREILITCLQSLLSVLFLMDLEFSFFNAIGLFILWAIQFFVPSLRLEVSALYLVWIIFESLLLIRKGKIAWALSHVFFNKRSR